MVAVGSFLIFIFLKEMFVLFHGLQARLDVLAKIHVSNTIYIYILIWKVFPPLSLLLSSVFIS